MWLIWKAWRYYREHGLRDFIHRIYRRRSFIVYVRTVETPEPVCDDPGVFFRVAGLEDVALLARELGHWGPDCEVIVRELLLAGDKAMIGLSPEDHSRVMYISWLSCKDRLFTTLLGERPDPAEACSRRLWVPQSYRGQGLAKRGLRFVERVGAQSGKKHIWAFVLNRNKASRKLHEQLGYETFGVLRVGRRWGKRFAEAKRKDDRRWAALNVVEQGGSGDSPRVLGDGEAP